MKKVIIYLLFYTFYLYCNCFIYNSLSLYLSSFIILLTTGGLCVLSRDESHARDEAPLALRYIVDCSQSSPTEALEFAEYMSHSNLYVDVWDADSLMLIGVIGIPLRRLMRQGQPVAKCVIECMYLYMYLSLYLFVYLSIYIHNMYL
jgi:hypothetical protein